MGAVRFGWAKNNMGGRGAVGLSGRRAFSDIPRSRWGWVVVCSAGLMTAALAADMSAKHPTVAEPETYRTDNYRAPVPATLKGGKVLSPHEAYELWKNREAIFIDVYPHPPKPANLPASTVWREPTHFTIENATWLANVGFGVLSDEHEAYFKRHLHALTGGDKTKPLVFFCLRNCWLSWNAAKRALAYGYSNAMWYSEGTDAWQEIGQPIAQVKPAP